MEAVGGTPYKRPEWKQVYTGRCRCFLHRESGYRIGKVMDCTHEVVIPDRNMVQIGENFKVGVKMHTNKDNRTWDLVGYVKDFARFDRVCNLYFQMVKENVIFEDVPPLAINTEKHALQSYEDQWFLMESIGLVEGDIIMEDEVVTLEFKQGFIPAEEEGEAPIMHDVRFFSKNAVGEWVEDRLLPVKFMQSYTEGYFDENTGETIHRGEGFGNKVYVFVPEYRRSGEVDPEVTDEERNVIRIEVWTHVQSEEEEPELVYCTEIAIKPKGVKKAEEWQEEGE